MGSSRYTAGRRTRGPYGWAARAFLISLILRLIGVNGRLALLHRHPRFVRRIREAQREFYDMLKGLDDTLRWPKRPGLPDGPGTGG